MKIKVMHILNSSRYSGAENVVITIMNHTKDLVESVYVSLDGAISEALESNNLPFYPIEKASISEYKRVIKEFNPDIIHAHDYTASIISVLAKPKCKIISHLHNNANWINKFHYYSIAYLISSIKYSKILTVSASIGEEYFFRKLISRKIVITSNPCDFDRVNALANKRTEKLSTRNSYDLIFLGRLADEKNPVMFIEVVSELKKINPKIKAGIIGEGPLEKKCITEIKKHNLQNNIDILGFIENPYEILVSSKILTMPSEWEGFGMVAFEALALGIPVVAKPVGGLIDILDNQCGLLTESKDSMVTEIIQLLDNNKYYNKKSTKALIKAKKLSNIDSYINNLNQLYKKTIGIGD